MFNNYRYYTNGRKVIAVSTYAGRRVKGVAVCSSDDTFDKTKGERLAAARCNTKIAKKRLQRADRKLREAEAAKNEVMKFYNNMLSYHADAYCAVQDAEQKEAEILGTM